MAIDALSKLLMMHKKYQYVGRFHDGMMAAVYLEHLMVINGSPMFTMMGVEVTVNLMVGYPQVGDPSQHCF